MKEIHHGVVKPDTDLMYRQLIRAWRLMADELAAAIRQEFDGFPDDEMFLTTTETLEKYDRLVAGTPEQFDGTVGG